MKTKPLIPIESEFTIQCQVVEYLELLQAQGKILLFTAVPNSTFTKSWGIKMKNKRLGVRPGLSDLVIVTPSKVIFLELKRERHGIVSDYQKAWITHLDNKKTISVVAEGFTAAKEWLDEQVKE